MGKKDEVCIKPVHFSLQVTEHNNAVLVLFSFASVKIHSNVDRTNCKQEKKTWMDFTESFMIIFECVIYFLCHAFFSPNDLTCNTVLFVCLQPCIYCNVHTVMLIVNYQFLLKHHLQWDGVDIFGNSWWENEWCVYILLVYFYFLL